LTARDNLRQAEADLITFAKSVTTLDLDGGGADIDPARISFVGLSLGAMVGTVNTAYTSSIRTSALSAPGGVITKLLLDSPAFGPSIIAGVGSQGLAFNSYLFNLYFRDFQAIIDSGDPINYIRTAQTAHPLVLFKILGDTVVPNNATDRLILAGGLTKYSSGTHAVGAGTGAYVTFTQGSHGTLFDPTASPAATAEMQGETVMFTASSVAPGGPFLTITNTAVIEP
jgi:pimeloyl-ACP methyl ester carboxylesterase